MSIDPARLRNTLDDWLGSEPHPRAPKLTRGEYQAYESLARLVHPQQKEPLPQQVESLGVQLKHLQLSGAEFERLWGVANLSSTRLLGRPPTIAEINHFREAHPGDISHYYESHPHPRYPEISAGQMADWYTAVKPLARRYAQRNPVENEVVTFAKGGYDHAAVKKHYSG